MYNLLSVIMPIYNGEKYLYQTMNSVLKQSYRNLEIIVINDGSTDSTRDILENFEKMDNRVKIFNIQNSGVSKARNYGLNYVNGNYISFLDADDILHKNCYEILMNELIGGGMT